MRAQSELEIRILDMIEPVATSLGLEIVRLRVTGSQTPTLQIMAELPDGTMTVARCAKLSRAISPILETEDPIKSEYHLEVSSPGIDRPLTRVGDFAKWIGHEIRVELGAPTVDGRKRFNGTIVSEVDGVVELDLKDGGSAKLNVADMTRAVMVLTDKLIQAARAKGQAPVEGADEEDDEDDLELLGEELGEDFDDVDVDEDEEFDGEDEDLDEDEDERK
ncbi:MAG TPA: ribosome maturation factor RimP [Hyphomonadaceae bacterium]|jgi:ribosome maturation factor RimP|nr:ribosome maturation factor RimP [Hyphomonadaceae bacterium]HPN07212.1 ribosome maturation factor RimP [Hyphomonadaceae bacterium]